MQLVRSLFLDLFNTLVSVGNVPFSVGKLTADILGFDHDTWNNVCFGPQHEICQPTQHIDIIRTLAHSIDPKTPDHLIEQAVTARQSRFDYALTHVEPVIIEALQQFKQQRLTLVLISNASTAEVQAWQHSPLSALFDHAIFSCESGFKKPQAEIYQHAMSISASHSSQCLYIGDGGSQEFLGAKQLELRTVLTKQFIKPKRYQHVIAEQGKAIDTEITTLNQLYF